MGGAERFSEVDTPALLLDLSQVERNIQRYQALASAAGVSLRPHAKAHKCPDLARLQVQHGAVGLCCAKLGEAEVLAAAGLTDLLVTTPVVGPLKVRRLVELAGMARIAVVADGARNIAELAQAAQARGVTVDVLVDVDVGQGRTGVSTGDQAAQLAVQISRSPALRFRGLQGYQGRLQGVASLAERAALVSDAMARLNDCVRGVEAAGMACPVTTGGGTGSFPIDLTLRALTELQPGSYVTMDSAYAKVRLSEAEDRHPLGQPLTILATVLSRPTVDRAVLDVGWKSASSDGGTPGIRGTQAQTFEFAGDEHGIVRSLSGPLELVPGQRVELVPTHCDTTVNLYDRFVIHRDGAVEAVWSIAARGKSQ